ncbi:MAG: hypothetical protein EAX90_01920 [Candidatus Heimdallarchaeota archaeon]|nr:hypothetical protein [Candidatus Heimdallarchaeota archaeon]
MEEKEILGILSKKLNQFILTDENGKEYKIYAINPWESVPPDFDTAKFVEFIGEKVKVSGNLSNEEIWNAFIHKENNKRNFPPKIDDLLK